MNKNCTRCGKKLPTLNVFRQKGTTGYICGECNEGLSNAGKELTEKPIDNTMFVLPKRDIATRVEYLTGMELFNLGRKVCSDCGREYDLHRTSCAFCQTFILCVYTDEVREYREKMARFMEFG